MNDADLTVYFEMPGTVMCGKAGAVAGAETCLMPANHIGACSNTPKPKLVYELTAAGICNEDVTKGQLLFSNSLCLDK